MLAAALLAAAATGPAAAQQNFDKVEIKVERVAPGVAVLFGSGGNIGVSYGVDGNVLIDDQFAPLVPKVVAAVRTLDPDPIAFLINTHWHFDHTGGNEALGKAGTVIVAQDNVRRRMAVDTVSSRFGTIKATGKAGLPVITFTRDISFHLNGDRLQVVHVPNAHTDGDSLIYWTGANVVHMGDVFFHRLSFPFIDRDSGGSIDGVIAAVRRGLALVRPGGKVIPGHGPVATRAELQAYHDMLVDVRAKVAAQVRAGRSRAEVLAARPAAAYAGKVAANGFIKADDFVGGIYDDLRKGRRR
ncbi:MBL fold metallo-hydrolase [Sphingomonas mesophila]|uniref:MBL fold metallo-hydrolase n=1 Tax=Sphingomonas mesophila TaxID=2303576 RepID=UPI000E580468|nr:MBL fold metallo-hydrolase [Sphingomonas mesophila]